MNNETIQKIIVHQEIGDSHVDIQKSSQRPCVKPPLYDEN